MAHRRKLKSRGKEEDEEAQFCVLEWTVRRKVDMAGISDVKWPGSVPTAIPTVPTFDEQIVGGKEASIEDFPYQLSLRYFDTHICGASVIGPKAALTAAHCTDGLSASDFSVRAGSSYKTNGGIIRYVQRVCQHPGYNPILIDNDVSVLILTADLPYSTTIQPISLVPINEQIPTDALATVTGWGTFASGGPLSSILQKVQVPKVTQESCQRSYWERVITSNMICFGFSSGGKDSCQGDSGGPLVYNGNQAGIVSWGIGCAIAGYPGVYTNIASPSILNHINSCVL